MGHPDRLAISGAVGTDGARVARLLHELLRCHGRALPTLVERSATALVGNVDAVAKLQVFIYIYVSISVSISLQRERERFCAATDAHSPR